MTKDQMLKRLTFNGEHELCESCARFDVDCDGDDEIFVDVCTGYEQELKGAANGNG